ncbi:hypothetical protein [Leeuwenhoekiella sp. MAR_2009_132]|uniref:hypothetical protein n=1 Tax=Leeuwenhoekiella sp. MAR_2009_132 TaxID=1392489 RepID=UPI000F6737B9|nr:hypothetical protein [Leeuwenhoekiella sp. MAR_2009_132]
MKLYTLLFLLIMSSTAAISQKIARVMVAGQVIVPMGDDPSGIVIYNKTSLRGTITSLEGTFDLAVAQNDEVVIQSLQFAPVTVLVDKGIVNSKQINITLRETITVLDEIVVTPYDLTGDIVADVNRVRVIEPVPFTGDDIRIEDSQYDQYSPAENVALDNQRWRYGLNFVNIFKAVFDINKNDDDIQKSAEDELAQMYSNQFFQENLNIKKEAIGAYMDYVAENGLSKEMLENGNELNLIQFLIEKRDDFEKVQNEKN